MSGSPGTPRFGDYSNKHKKKTTSQGDSSIALQDDGDFDEIHYSYNPDQQASAVGAPRKKYFQTVERQYDAPSNHDGWFGGDAHLINVDERKVLDNYLYSQKITCADDEQTISGSRENS